LGYIAASESCAFPAGTVFHSEVEPGEMVEISRNGVKSVWQMVPKLPAFCIFGKQLSVLSHQAMLLEYVYFARPDSYLEGQQVHTVRRECGRILAKESHVDADIVSIYAFFILSSALFSLLDADSQYRFRKIPLISVSVSVNFRKRKEFCFRFR
jgi:amidophosphoribosyltransferase